MTFKAAEKVEGAFESLIEGWRSRPGFLIFLIGVVLPVMALVTELSSHLCGGAFFNPVPTLLHSLLVAMVPAANLWLYLCLRQGRLGKVRLLAWSNGNSHTCSAIIVRVWTTPGRRMRYSSSAYSRTVS